MHLLVVAVVGIGDDGDCLVVAVDWI